MPKGARSSLPRSNVTPQPSNVIPQPQPELFDLYRSGFKGALDWMQVSLQNAERLQNQQLTAFRSALDAQLQAASALGEAMSMFYEKSASVLNAARQKTTEGR
ncbi:MAG: hypothetical protein ACJ8G5_04515 [Burkholderiales bacterium]